jgi:hypothetical protein
MFNPDQSVSYLPDDASQSQPQEHTIQHPHPMVNPNIDLSHNEQWQDYPHRVDVAPYMSRYNRPPALHQKSLDVLGSVSPTSSSFKTGLLLSSLMLMGSVGGYSLEKMLSKKVKPKGYGAIIGTLGSIGLYYTVSKMMSSGLMQGAKAASGFVIPMIPLFIGMYRKKPLDRNISLMAAGVAAIGSGYVVVTNLMSK